MHTGCKNRRGVPGALLGAEGARGEARAGRTRTHREGRPRASSRGLRLQSMALVQPMWLQVASSPHVRAGWPMRGRTEGRGRMQTKENPLRKGETAFPETVGKCSARRDASARWSRHHFSRAVW